MADTIKQATIEQMRAHVDEGGTLTHRNAVELLVQVEHLTGRLTAIMDQTADDLKAAHAEICKLQNLDPETHDWPEWSAPKNTLRWFDEIRSDLGLKTVSTV